MRRSRFPRALIVTVGCAALLAAGLLGSSPAPAVADTAPSGGLPATVSDDALPTPQINGVVWTQTVVGNTVFVGGSFTKARPSGSAPGTNEVTRNNLLAYNLTTGALITAFAPSLNGQVRGLAASKDGVTLYAVGDFTSVNGVTKNHIVALNTSSGSVVSSFTASLNGNGYAVATTSTAVYVGGSFTASGSASRTRAAAFNSSTGALLSFAPAITHTDSTVSVAARGIVVSPDGTKVVIGGNFDTVNGSTQKGSAQVDAATGKTDQPWAVNRVILDNGSGSAIFSLTSDGTYVYATGYSYHAAGGQGPLEGSFSASWSGGTIRWIEDCHGDSYSIAPIGSVVYVASHEHYCANVPNGFPQEVNSSGFTSFQRGTAFTSAPTGTLRKNTLSGYANFAGQPAPTLLDWYPSFTTGTYTGQNQGAWSVAGNGSYVVYGGEFPSVNGTSQQGLVRFALPSISHRDGPRLSAYTGNKWAIGAISLKSGSARVEWPANYDRDNATLTYTLLRNGTAVYTTTAASQVVYHRPVMSFTDTGLANGSSYTYQVRATDPNGNSAVSASTSVTVTSTNRSSVYEDAVLKDAPDDYWRLDEVAGSTVLKDTAGPWDLTAQSGVTLGRTGPVKGDTGTCASFSGSPSGVASTTQLIGGTDEFSLEGWFKTSSTTGGQIVGMGAYPTGTDSVHDRQVYLDGAGHVLFTVDPGSVTTVGSGTRTYRDNAWHAVVATLSPAGMKLYVDGTLVGTNTATTRAKGIGGSWRVGGDATASGDGWFDGLIDNVAVYNSHALTATQVSAHYQAGANAVPAP